MAPKLPVPLGGTQVDGEDDEDPVQLPPHDDENKMEEMVNVLLEQQSALQNIIRMQAEMRAWLQNQHQKMDSKLTDLSSKALHQADLKGLLTSQHEALEAKLLSHNENLDAKITDISKKASPFWDGCSSGEQSETTMSPHKSSKEKTFAGNLNVKRPSKKERASKQVNPFDLRGSLQTILTSPGFDVFMGALVLINFFCILGELEWKNMDYSFKLGLQKTDGNWGDVEYTFKVIEKVFNVIFVLELLLCAYAFRCRCITSGVQALDAFAVIIAATDSLILDPIFAGDTYTAFELVRLLRLLRMVKLGRFLRVLRTVKFFEALRVLVRTIQGSLGSLVWSMALVFSVIICAAMLMGTMCQTVLEDPAVPHELREWVYRNYGGVVRSSYTMFVATFSARWAGEMSERLIFEVSPWFSMFWVLYTVTVNFAVMRVISALFLKQTLDMAAKDAERVAALKMAQLETSLEALRQIFNMADQAGDGVLHRWEFQDMLENEECMKRFDALELEAPELMTLYDILAEDDGVVDQEEFLAGAMKLKTQVKNVDIIHIMHEQMTLKRILGEMSTGLHTIDKALHPRNPWKCKYGAHHHESAMAPTISATNGVAESGVTNGDVSLAAS